VIPEWNVLATGDNYPLHTRLGLNSDEFISVYVKKIDQFADIESYGEDIARWNDKYLNKKCYSLLEKGSTHVAGYPAYKITFRLTLKGKNYIVDDYYIHHGNFVYNLTLKAPEEKYASQIETYNKMLDTFRINQLDEKSLVKEVDSYWIKYGNQRLGKNDETVKYQNKTFKWSAEFPGYWEKYTYSDESLQLFILPDSGVQIGIEALELNEYIRKFDYTERFSLVALLMYKYDMKEMEKKTIYAKGTNITMYRYRIDDDEQEAFADLKYYFIDTKDKSYCFMIYLPDLFSSDAVRDEVERIWDSFNVS